MFVSTDLFVKNRDRLLDSFKDLEDLTIILLKGGTQQYLYNTDREVLFRQESNFHWLFGVEEPDFYGALIVNTGESILFAPTYHPDHPIWAGNPPTNSEIVSKYQVTMCYTNRLVQSSDNETETLVSKLQDWVRRIKPHACILTIEPLFGIEPNLNLIETISGLRSIKTPEEIELMRYVIKISSEAHNYVLKHVCPGMKEYELEALFLYYVYRYGGCRHVGYNCVCGSGPHTSILHYTKNEREIKNGDILMLDMGAEYRGYTADISCSFPANGKFDTYQKAIYNAVAAAQNAVISQIRPGVFWTDLHLLAEKVILQHLQFSPLSIINPDVDLVEAQEKGLGAVFFPHGLGHLLGIDVHDVGGYLSGTPQRPTRKGICNLRTARKLEPNMILTVEPGIYFINALMDAAIKDPQLSQYLNIDQLEKFRGWGGIRLEDDILVTSTGCENLTSCPRTPEEVEELMAH